MKTLFFRSRQSAIFAAMIVLSSVLLPLELEGQTGGEPPFGKPDPIRVYVDPWTANSPTIKGCLALLRNDAAFEIVVNFEGQESADAPANREQAYATVETLLKTEPALFREFVKQLQLTGIHRVRIYPAGLRTSSSLLRIHSPQPIDQFWGKRLADSDSDSPGQTVFNQIEKQSGEYQNLLVIIRSGEGPVEEIQTLYRIGLNGSGQLQYQKLEKLELAREAPNAPGLNLLENDSKKSEPITLLDEPSPTATPQQRFEFREAWRKASPNTDSEYWDGLLTSSEIQTAVQQFSLNEVELKRFLKAAFNAKQFQLLFELQQLRTELQTSEIEITNQFSQSDAIIANRLAKLLDPSANSNNPPTTASNPLELTAGNSTAESITLLPKTPSATVQSLDWSSPVDLVTKISEIRIAQKSLPVGETVLRAEYQKYLEALRIAFDSRLKLSEQDVQFATKKLALVKENLENVVSLYKSGALSAEERNQKMLELTESENALLQAETRYNNVLDLMKKIADETAE